MRVLGIESSCDDTGVALYCGHDGLLAHRLHSQIETHAGYGGVVPELASRDHIRRVGPLLETVLADAGLERGAIDGIAYTRGPGLAGALLVGGGMATSLAWALEQPLLGVHHMEGHLLAAMLEPEPPQFPFVACLVSGGHSLLVEVTGYGRYRLLGRSLDDAAGEAFDKTAKLLELPYPGGPALEALAAEGDPDRFRFPRPMTDRPGLDLSFSGLKTFTANTLREQPDNPTLRADVARGFQDAVLDTLFIKCRRALEATGIRRLVVAGGVGANAELRRRMAALDDMAVHYPRPGLCTDNGAMIAYAGYVRLAAGETSGHAFDVQPRWPLDELQPPAAVA